MTPPIGYFEIASIQPAMRVVMLHGDSPPTISGGYGGWAAVQRPKRLSLTEWGGSDPFNLSISFILDKFASDVSVQDLITNLERMATVFPGYPTPPQVQLEGAIPHTELTWVIQGIDWGNKELNRSGEVTRQTGTLSLMQFVEDELVIENRPKAGSATKWKWHTLKKGDTIATLTTKYAKKPIGKAKIAQFKKLLLAENKIRDPRSPFKGLKKIKVPLI